MARVVVVGAAGMLGREVIAALHGHEVVPSVREPRPDALTFDAERDDPEVLLAGEPDLIVNCAAVLAGDAGTNPALTNAVNVELPHRLAATGVRLVHISTDAVFNDTSGVRYEDDIPESLDPYGASKRAGEPDAQNALTLRCSFIGLDPRHRRGLVEWLLAQPPGTRVSGYVDQAWNGLVASQVASTCAALTNAALFDRARTEGAVHHLFEDPALTKYEVVAAVVDSFSLDLTVEARPSDRPVTRLLATRRRALREHLLSGPGRTASLKQLAQRRTSADG